MQSRRKVGTRSGFVDDPRSLEDLDAQSGTDPTVEQRAFGTRVEIRPDIDRLGAATGSSNFQTGEGLSIGIEGIVELVLVGDGNQARVPA
jgi:hypothetical protein